MGVGAASGAVAGAVGWVVPTLLPAGGPWGSGGIGALSGLLSSAAGQVVANLLTPCTPWHSGLGWAIATGVVTGGIAGGVGWLTLAIWGHPSARAANVTLDDFVQHAFGGDWEQYSLFLIKLRAGLPRQTSVAVRGSAVTGHNWLTGRAFDALGPGTSDIDLVLVGDEIMQQWNRFKIPGMYTASLGDTTPYVAPGLNPLRLELQAIAGRPVNIQAASQAYIKVRLWLQRTSYLWLVK